jgi:hypothetical protein
LGKDAKKFWIIQTICNFLCRKSPLYAISSHLCRKKSQIRHKKARPAPQKSPKKGMDNAGKMRYLCDKKEEIYAAFGIKNR